MKFLPKSHQHHRDERESCRMLPIAAQLHLLCACVLNVSASIAYKYFECRGSFEKVRPPKQTCVFDSNDSPVTLILLSFAFAKPLSLSSPVFWAHKAWQKLSKDELGIQYSLCCASTKSHAVTSDFGVGGCVGCLQSFYTVSAVEFCPLQFH